MASRWRRSPPHAVAMILQRSLPHGRGFTVPIRGCTQATTFQNGNSWLGRPLLVVVLVVREWSLLRLML